MTRILAIDLGLRRTGLALSDELHLTTRALPNLVPKSRAEDIEHLLRLCEEFAVAVVIIGYPLLPKSAQEGPMARRARGFYDAFMLTAHEKRLPLEVYLVDESFSSRDAVERLLVSDISKKRRRDAVDGEAARILIEEFIAMNSHRPENV